MRDNFQTIQGAFKHGKSYFCQVLKRYETFLHVG